MTESLKYFSIMNLCNLITILGNIMKEQQILSYMRGTSAVNLIVDFPSFLANKCKEEPKKIDLVCHSHLSKFIGSQLCQIGEHTELAESSLEIIRV